MRNTRVSTWIRLLMIICGFVLVYVLFIPIWRIELNAPQYPEGLKLLIYSDKLGGNVDIINGLNHYIGMKTLHTGDFFEFSILRYIILFYALAFIVVGIMGKRKFLNLLLILFISFGILAMYDFWRWEYNYGHNLNPDAAIIVPGMSYQPPLIGFKQLLNFGAYSVPDIGGWIFVGAGAILLFCTLRAWVSNKKRIHSSTATMVIVLLSSTLFSCNAGPEPIKTGTDNCSYCKMTMSDDRFGAEVMTSKGKVYKFDDMHCVLSWIKSAVVPSVSIKDIYFTDFCNRHELIDKKKSFFLKSDALKSPMGGNTAVFSNADSMKKMQESFSGNIITWDELNKQ